MKLFRNLGGALSLALLAGTLVSSVPAGAQTLTALSIERSIALSNVLTTISPTGIPAATLAAIAAGSLDIREQINYNPVPNAVTSTVFVVATGAPTPTNISQLPFASFVASTTTSVDKIYLSTAPFASVMITGTVNQSTATPYGNYLGANSVLSFGYTADKPPKINNVVETIAGAVMIYSPSATGTFTITAPPGSGGGGSGSGVTININGKAGLTPTIETTTSQLIIDASGSTSSNAGALTYAWSVTSGTASISFPNGKTSVAQVQLGSGKLTYTLKLTVTDATGASSVATITINFI